MHLNDAQRTRVLLVNLLLVGACVLGLIGLIVVYPLAFGPPETPPPTASHTPRPSFAPTASFTPPPSPTLTLTPRPSDTPTLTATFTASLSPTPTALPTGLPTLTPARAAVSADGYELHPWTAEHADYLARLMQSYPASLADPNRAGGEVAYALTYRFPIFAWREALLRFPDAPQVDAWRWGLAHGLAQYGDAEAGEQYARLIADALNAEETDVALLYHWFSQREPSLALVMTALDRRPQGYLSSYVLELRGETGSAFIWLLQAPSGYRAYSLLTRFDPLARPQVNWAVADLNGIPEDGQEIAISFQEDERMLVDPPAVFNLSQTPPTRLPFYPERGSINLGLAFNNRWAVRSAPDGQNLLVLDTLVFPACPVRVEMAYRWNGRSFARQSQSYTWGENGLDSLRPDLLPYCEMLVDHAAVVWGPEATIALMEPLLTQWPPAQDLAGDAYPADALDEWRYRLGVYYALLDDQPNAQRYLNLVSTQPVVYNSRWVAPAQAFLGAYHGPDTLYRACVLSEVCDPAQAIKTIVGRLQPQTDALTVLREAGMNPVASGYFDFDGDGESERWFTARYRPRAALAFWILLRTADGWALLYVDTVETSPASLDTLDEAYIADEGLALQPATFLEGRLAFTVRREPGTQQPYLLSVPLRREYPSQFFLPLAALERGLFLGHDPAGVQDDLETLAEFPGLLCAPFWSCDSYYYLLGLSAEMAGDERAAVKAYHKLWQDYSRSPFAIMARVKLMGDTQAATATPSITPTLAGTPSPTATVFGTSLPTATGGATQTPGTVTPTLSPTVTGTPTFTVTGTPPTPTPTLTPSPTTGGGYPGVTTVPSVTPPYP